MNARRKTRKLFFVPYVLGLGFREWIIINHPMDTDLCLIDKNIYFPYRC